MESLQQVRAFGFESAAYQLCELSGRKQSGDNLHSLSHTFH